MSQPPTSRLTILSESETAQGWAYQVRLLPAPASGGSRGGGSRGGSSGGGGSGGSGGKTYDFEVTLSWSEHDLWSKGRVPPEKVVRAAFAFLLEREPADAILARFDCAVIRRYFPEVDKVLPGLIGKE